MGRVGSWVLECGGGGKPVLEFSTVYCIPFCFFMMNLCDPDIGSFRIYPVRTKHQLFRDCYRGRDAGLNTTDCKPRFTPFMLEDQPWTGLVSVVYKEG